MAGENFRTNPVRGKRGDRLEIEKRMAELGIHLPEVAKPVASYVPAVISGNLVFVSGNVALIEGRLVAKGRLGEDVPEERGYECARIAALTCLAAVKSVIHDLDRVRRIIRVTGFVRSAPGFDRQPFVVNGASDVLLEIFGEAGKHSRLAIGTNELPLGAPVEIEMIVEIKP